MDVINTLKSGERVTSIYAETYYEDASIGGEDNQGEPSPVTQNKSREIIAGQTGSQEWVSPSDLLIGKVELTPPFTSKITRGITHEGIISIGNAVLSKERKKFEIELYHLLRDNDAAWYDILMNKKEEIKKSVEKTFKEIFEQKTKILSTEISHFYENSLQELEDHLRSEIQNVLISAHADIISDLNTEINKRLKKERIALEKHLEEKYKSEIDKITNFYKLLADYELNRNNNLISAALQERNDALNVFNKQIEAETMTSTMYVMSLERKKCKIKQFLLENYQSSEIKEKLHKIKVKEEVLDSYKQRERFIADIDYEWREKTRKVLQLFLKFISFSLKLLPEQTTFLLDLEKMFVLQLNEIQKQPKSAPNILIDVEDCLNNVFNFEQTEVAKATCEKEPFEIVGDLSESKSGYTHYGSRETIPSNVDLPSITVLKERRFLYAKCNKFEEVKALLGQKCICMGTSPDDVSSTTSLTEPERYSPKQEESVESSETESSIELMHIEDIKRMKECPYRYCQDWRKRTELDITPFMDYSEENFKTISNILTVPHDKVVKPKVISAKEMARRQLPFVSSPKPYCDAATQCSSEEDFSISKLNVTDPPCTCVSSICIQKKAEEKVESKRKNESRTKLLNEIMVKRRTSLQRMLFSNPNLLKVFTDESYDVKI